MLLALQSLDYAVLLLYLLVVVLIGLYYSRRQRNHVDFLLAGRSLGWFPAGLSLAVTLISTGTCNEIAAAAYDTGWKQLVLPALLWLILPLVSGVVVPLFRRLELLSIYDYLEQRFDLSVRWAASLLFVLWRLFWLAAVLYAPGKLLVVAGGLSLPEPLLLIGIGATCTLYTWMGGMKAVVWTDVVQAVLLGGGLLLLVLCAWWQLEGGPDDVWAIATRLNRSDWLEPEHDGASPWSAWGLLPHLFFSLLFFYTADQLAAQRYLATRSVTVARRSLVFHCVAVSLFVPLLIYVGLCLLAFYQQHPQAMRPIWVANLDNKTRTPLTEPESGAPLLDWGEDGAGLDRGQVEPEYLNRLLAAGRLRRPNSKEPYSSEALDDLYDPEARSVRVERLGMRDRRGEWLLAEAARAELLPHFLKHQLPMGLAGLFVAALLAASMSSLDSGLNSISTLLVVECCERGGWRPRWPGSWCWWCWWVRSGESGGGDLGPADQLRLGRFFVLLLGGGATVAALCVGPLGGLAAVLVTCLESVAGPVLGVFLLGMFSRRVTARAALAALIVGLAFSLWFSVANRYDACRFLWPLSQQLGPHWALAFGVSFTLLVGYLLSFLVGRPRSRNELRGLVYGLGKLGVRDPQEAAIAIEDPEKRKSSRRWK